MVTIVLARRGADAILRQGGSRKMETTITTDPPTNEAEAEAVLARILEQMREVREQMKADDAEIARLKAESAELRTETRAILARLQGTK